MTLALLVPGIQEGGSEEPPPPPSQIDQKSPVWIGLTREKLVAKGEFNSTMDKHTVKVVKGDETVGHLPRKFTW